MLNKPRFSFAVSVFAVAMLSACASQTPGTTAYSRPALNLPAADATAKAQDYRTWWKGFADPVLDALLDEATRNNQDLALATARVAEASASMAQSNANLYPTVDLNASATRRRGSENTASFSPGSQPVSEDRQLGLTATYEFDFWGKYARADDAARARLLAQSASRGAVLTALYANVAQSYFALRALDTQATLAERTLATRQENLRLQKRRFDAGVVGELDLRQAESEAANVKATLQQVQQSRNNAEAALAVLVGRQPADIVRPVLARGLDLSALYAAQTVPANLPSDILTTRPDVVSAEQNLIAAHADIGQARAAYFPKLSLTANVGQQSKDMSTLFDPASLFWSMIGNLTQPIFRAGAIDALVSAANSRQQQALAQYTQTVQNAFRDVHDAMNNVDAGRQIAETTATRIQALRETQRLAELRYKAGYTGYLEVLNAQRDLMQAESGLIDVQRNQLSAVVSLYKALGGGWDAASVQTAKR
jgi:multidrug efflux system outer membrane protein